ncbi:hypothetical protein CBS101457_004635 [Exobasidium rhododendri]|nr:hypothetical protein CBS101457_004635 [Exobasidium rhododendri]
MEGDLSRGSRLALVAAQRSMEDAVYHVHKELTSLQGQYAELQQKYEDLQQEHASVESKYDSEREDWKAFRAWWQATIDRKKAAAQQTPSKSSTSSSPSVPTSDRKRKGNLSESETTMLEKVGLSCSGIAAGPSEPKKETRRQNVQESVAHESETVLSVSKLSPITPAPQKKLKSLGSGEKSSISSRSPLQELVNDPSPHKNQQSERGHLTITDRREGLDRKMVELKKDPLKHKGRGRYSAGICNDASTSRTINAEFEINAEQNGNVSFLHKDVVRDKAERKRMHAYDCACCSEYYMIVGDAPLRRFEDPRASRGERRKDTAEEEAERCSEDERDEEEHKRQIHRQAISRHRDRGPPASTPPGYWDVGFPNTQKQEEINRQVREEYKKKPARMAQDPRFKRRSMA